MKNTRQPRHSPQPQEQFQREPPQRVTVSVINTNDSVRSPSIG
jgi:hypothetical protein